MEQVIHTPQNLTHLSWSKVRASSGTAGSFLKSQEQGADGKIYYKLSDYDSFHGVTGHECINEIMADKPVQCFVGSRSAWENLQLIPRNQFPRLSPLKESDRTYLLDGLDDALAQLWLDRSWDMIWRRWQTYENLRNQR